MASTKIVNLLNAERVQVRGSIKKLLTDHANNPFGTLREAGIQAELRSLLLTKFAKPVTALLVTHDGRKRFNWRTPVKVKRVQLEMKVGVAQRDSNPAETNAASRTDIVVLTAKHHVELICHPNGPGDVVAALRPEDVKVAIEIKAAPSRTNQQKQKYADDIVRLLWLNRSHGIASFFVMLDKSQTLYGEYINKPRAATINDNNWAALKNLIPGINVCTALPRNVKNYIEICFIDGKRKPCIIYAWIAVVKSSTVHNDQP